MLDEVEKKGTTLRTLAERCQKRADNIRGLLQPIAPPTPKEEGTEKSPEPQGLTEMLEQLERDLAEIEETAASIRNSLGTHI